MRTLLLNLQGFFYLLNHQATSMYSVVRALRMACFGYCLAHLLWSDMGRPPVQSCAFLQSRGNQQAVQFSFTRTAAAWGAMSHVLGLALAPDAAAMEIGKSYNHARLLTHQLPQSAYLICPGPSPLPARAEVALLVAFCRARALGGAHRRV